MIKKTASILIFAANLMAQWTPVDSLSVTVRVPAKEHVCFTVDPQTGSLSVALSASTQKLSLKAREAIGRAPAWLSIALEDRFAGLSTSLQDAYAQIILDARDPYVDEIAFTIAHLSPEVLQNKSFYPSIITENAAGIYSADTLLQYVTIVDSGSAAQGGDYYSTTRYRVKENGSITEYTLPREYYYWFIVHPKLQGELPTYISTTAPESAAPPSGKFWRTYLWSHKETGYGALCDTMKEVTFLWANKINSPAENGAIGRLSQWCNLILPWGGHPKYRWPQPVYLYHQHSGTCSEHGWFASAAARTVLIPATLTKAARFDHKWNEFFCGRWVDWEPINGWIDRRNEPAHANEYWADPAKGRLNCCFNWRGDGYIWNTTERYTEVCTLAVRITDALGRPLDGARVTIDAAGVPGNFLTAAWTGSDGLCSFLLGDSISSFTAAIKSQSGDLAAKTVISNSLPGKRYEWSPKTSGNAPALTLTPTTRTLPDSGAVFRIAFSADARREIVYGRHEYSLYDYSFPCTFSDERRTGTVDLFICDSGNIDGFMQNGRAEAAVIRNDISSIDTFFTVPAATGKWHLVATGREKAVVTSVVTMTLRLLRREDARIAEEPRLRRTGPALAWRMENGAVILACAFSAGRCGALCLYSVSGKRIAEFSSGSAERSGVRSFTARQLPAGAYLARLNDGERIHVARIAVVW